ncbi:MAG: thiamine pyrophosphate-binding protein [Gammaproteobacteria bacterium]|nr:thiamine pyrophosphate-binding protein [Gammaproteobacteria bacterium]
MAAGSNQLNGAEAFVRMLQLHGVRHIFGLCGDTSLPFYDALYRLDHGIEHVLTRDERSAAYMADGYARVTGKVGICEAPSGGGATYILPGIVEASESSIPVLGITSDISTTARGRFALTELDQESLFKPLTKYSSVIDRADRLPAEVRAAFRAMTTARPGAAHLGLPFDVQKDEVPEAYIWADEALGRFPAWPVAPDPQAVETLLDVLLSAKKPLIICGGAVVIAGGEGALGIFAEALDIPVATTISGQGSLPETHPLAVGVVGSNGGIAATRAVVQSSDLIFFIGCRAGSVTTERWCFPAPGTRVVHLDVDPSVIGANYRTEAALLADARLGLNALNVALDERGAVATTFDGKKRAGGARARKAAYFAELSASNDVPIRPERLVAELRAVLPDDAVVIADPGTPCPYLSAFYELRETGRHFWSNRAHGALGYSMSAAVGAWYGRPSAKIVAVMGDGSFGFTVGELETIVRQKVPLTMVVCSNAAFGWIKAGQRSGFDERYFSVDFDRTHHAGVAEAFGVKAWRVADPAALRAVLGAAVEHDGPALVDVICQPLHEARAPVSEWVA